MKILSYNIRGLGKRAKRREVREMVKKHRIEFCCIQETKMSNMRDKICKSLWGDKNCEWACMDAEGNSGGILSIWNNEVFSMVSSWFVKGVLVVNGFLKEDGQQVCVMNVYAPCSSTEIFLLWDLIGNAIEQQSNTYTCVVGDFNAIRHEKERVEKGSVVNHRDILAFDEFISQSNLFEIPLIGRFFTWFRKDGSCKSKLDRMLVNEEWLNKWPNYSLKSDGRSLSDHCPIFSEVVIKDWGPKPFRFINSWISHPEFKQFIKQKWEEHKVMG